ncbi:Hypothetical protein FKW44_017752, partial [Caligus rogercresseyi]
CRCAVKSGAGRLPLGIFRRGEPPPSLYGRPSREKPPRKAIDPVTAEVCTL